MRELPLDEYTEAVAEHLGREPDEALRAACAIAQEKAQTLNEVWPLIGFLFEEPERRPEGLEEGDGGRRQARAGGRRLRRCEDVDPFEPDEIEAALAPILAERDVKPGKLYQPIRVAISGGTVSPGIFESLAVLGQETARLHAFERAAGRAVRRRLNVRAKQLIVGCR